jgi:hypothetical protein
LKSEMKTLRESLRERSDRLDTERARLEALEIELSESHGIINRRQSREDERQEIARHRLEELLGISVPTHGEALQRAISATESLLTKISVLTERIRAHESETNTAVAMLKQLSEDSDPAETLAEINKDIAEADRSLAAHQTRAIELELQASEETSREASRRQFAELALEQLGEVCPVCQQKYDKEHAASHLRSLAKEKSTAATLREEANRHREEAALAAADLETIRRRQLEAGRLAAEYQAQSRRAESERQLAETGRTELMELLGGRWQDAAAAATELRNLIETLAALAVEDSRNVGTRVAALEVDLKSDRARVQRAERDLAELQIVVERSDATTKWLGERLVKAATAVVRGTTPLINEIYSRLDVHPSLRRFDFKVDRFYQAGRLRPWVFDDEREVDGNAAQVLSAAQLNALAVCVFLALNLKQTWSPLRVTMLDDPVQSMDDVNVLGLADTFRSLRAYRQTFVSTHDSSLAKLLWRKLRPLSAGQRTVHVQLAEWTREGPTVESQTRDAPPKDLGLELVAS